MRVFGCVIVDGAEYHDDAIKSLVGTQFGLHGTNWVFGGDQGFDESDIYIRSDGCGWDFHGCNALNDALERIAAEQEG